MANNNSTPKAVEIENRPLVIEGHEFYVSILHYHANYGNDPEKEQGITMAAMQALAADLEKQPKAAEQRSVCLVTNLEAIADQVSEELINEWFSKASAQNVQTQQYLYQLFKRPVFQINVLPGFDAASLNARNRALNPNANLAIYTESMAGAVELAKRQLKVAHRL